jgi:hypothetical protein
MSKGCSNFSFGKARTTLKGGGGSGDPTTREVVHGGRAGVSFFFSGSALPDVMEASAPARARTGSPVRTRNGFRRLREDSGINITRKKHLEGIGRFAAG